MSDSEELKIVKWEIPLRSIVPKKLYEAMNSREHELSDAKLMEMAVPDQVDWRLRIRFQSLLQQYTDANIEMNRVITQEDIYKDVCTYEVWRRRIEIPAKAAFITRKIGTFLEDQDALLTAASTRLWEIMSAPITNNDGTINAEAVKLLHKTINMMLDRKFGKAIERRAHKIVNEPSTFDPLTIEAQIREIEGGGDGK